MRGHRAVENQCHWVLEVAFREDPSRARSGHTIADIGLLLRLALNCLRKDKSIDRGIHRKQIHAAINPDLLRQLLKIGCVGPGKQPVWQPESGADLRRPPALQPAPTEA